MVIYPNPAKLSDKLLVRIKNGEEQQAYIVISDVSGRMHFADYAALNENAEVDLYTLKMTYRLERGVYLISVISGTFRTIEKVVIK